MELAQLQNPHPSAYLCFLLALLVRVPAVTPASFQHTSLPLPHSPVDHHPHIIQSNLPRPLLWWRRPPLPHGGIPLHTLLFLSKPCPHHRFHRRSHICDTHSRGHALCLIQAEGYTLTPPPPPPRTIKLCCNGREDLFVIIKTSLLFTNNSSSPSRPAG
jgi:hypothetical protein